LTLELATESAVETLAAELGPNVALVHLADWQPPSATASTSRDRELLLEINVMGTLRALDAARQARVSQVVYASSWEVYGIPQAVPVTEASATRPFSDYGASKLAGEDHLFAFATEEELPAIALRMPPTYGPGEHGIHALPDFLRTVARGERPKILGDGLDHRDQLHATDAALGIECALGSSRSGAYNLADGEAYTILDLARAALAVAGLGGEPELLPAQIQRCDFHMSIAKIQSELGFAPRVRLTDGMAQQLRWLRAGGA
jgi:nucleoside-diphosphate-sugar epimerase